MARAINRLNALKVSKTVAKGMYADGGGLYLQVTQTGAKSWIYRYMRNGKSRDMGLGSASVFTLADAREKVAECRKRLSEGQDPIEQRDQAKKESALQAARSITFQECADRYIEAHASGWKNAKHLYQWRSTLSNIAGPVIGKLPVQDVDTALVMKVLEKVWKKKPETASRLRGRIEAVLDWATAREYRATGQNPARWKGHLDHLLPVVAKAQRVRHQPALPYADIPAFMTALRLRQSTVAGLALEMTILTCCRTSEVICSEWREFDIENRLWTIPADRMKAGVEHRVPLTSRMLDILAEMRIGAKRGPFVFRGKPGKPLSNTAMLMLLRRMPRNDITVHGFRSTFRDWVRDCTDHRDDTAEEALAHAIENKVKAAYARGDMLEKRRRLMDDWNAYCGASGSSAGC